MSPASSCKDLAIIPPQIKSMYIHVHTYTIILTGFDITVKSCVTITLPSHAVCFGCRKQGSHREMKPGGMPDASCLEETLLPEANKESCQSSPAAINDFGANI